jgi:hypothetical protein
VSQRRVGYDGRRPRVIDEGPASASSSDPLAALGRLSAATLRGVGERLTGGAGPIERRQITDAERATRLQHATPGLVRAIPLVSSPAAAAPLPVIDDANLRALEAQRRVGSLVDRVMALPATEEEEEEEETVAEPAHIMTTETPPEAVEPIGETLSILADAVVEAIEANDALAAAEAAVDQARANLHDARKRWTGARLALDAAYRALDDPPPAIVESGADYADPIPGPVDVAVPTPVDDPSPPDPPEAPSRQQWLDAQERRARAAALTGAAAAKTEPAIGGGSGRKHRSGGPLRSNERRIIAVLVETGGDRKAAAARLGWKITSVQGSLGRIRSRTDLTDQERALVASKRGR